MNKSKNQKNIYYVSDSKTVQTIRKKLSLNRFNYKVIDSSLVSVSFKIEQIKNQNYKIFANLLDLLSLSNNIEDLNVQIISYKIEKENFIELIKKFFQLKNLKSLHFLGKSLNYQKEIMGYFTKFLILSLRNLTTLDLNFSSNKFGDDGIHIFGLGIVNLKILSTLKLNFSHCKMKGSGLKTLLTNMGILKKLEFLELVCEDINKDDNFEEKYLECLKLMKKFTMLKFIKLNFSSNNLSPFAILSTTKLFLKNVYFDKLTSILLDLNSNCNGLSWHTFENFQFNNKKKYDKYLQNLQLDFSKNFIRDADFRYFYDILIYFKGLKNFKLNLKQNELKHFRSNIFFIFGSIGQNLTLENVEIDVSENSSVYFQNFAITSEHIPDLDQMKCLIINSNLPLTQKIEMHFANFLKKFINLEKLDLTFPESLDNMQIKTIMNAINIKKKLKILNLDLCCFNLNEVDFGNMIDLLQNLENLIELKLIIRSDMAILRDNFSHLITLLKFCQKLDRLTLSANLNEIVDQRFNADLRILAKDFLYSNRFLEIERMNNISSLFLKKKSQMYIATVLKKNIKHIYKRNLILSEILELF